MKLNQILVVGGAAVVLCLSTSELMAQAGGGGGGGRGNRGNFDPAQFEQMMMDRYKEQLEIKDDGEWKVIQPLVKKVSDARRATFSSRGFGRNRGGGGAGGGGGTTQGGPPGFGTPDPTAEALQKAIESKASGAEVKAALAKFVDSRKAKQAALEKAQADLRTVLTPRQEAIACLNGLL